MRKIQHRIILAYTYMKKYILSLRFKNIIKWIMLSVLLSILLGAGVVYGYIASLLKDVPVISKKEILVELENHNLKGVTYFNDQTEIGWLWNGEDRLLTEFSDIPQQVIDAFVAIEDKNFYSHHGIDIQATLRAIKQQIGNEHIQTGGSTITQQLTRRVFLSLDQTYKRKASEIFLAMRMERILSKDEIIHAYLTDIYFGRGSDGNNLYGIKSAAKGIFGLDDLYDLNPAQAAYLAGLPQRPSAFSAYDNKGLINPTALRKATIRQKLVLTKMRNEKIINQDEYESAIQYDIEKALAPTKVLANDNYPFLMTEVERRATEILLKLENPTTDENDSNYKMLLEETRSLLLSKGYKIHTTIDPTIYKEMKKIAEDTSNFTEDGPEKGMEQIGAIMIDNQSGAILGMLEGRDFEVEQLNHATQMVRQPGSAMKPIAAYLPALENGSIQPASIIDDVPLVLETGGGSVHIPENWDGKFHGLVTAREALKWSYNIPALKIFNNIIGIKEAWEFAHRLGITTIVEQDIQAKTGVLGGLTYGVTVEELTNAYVSIANQGTYNDTYLVERIEDAKGEIIYEHQHDPKFVFSEQTAYLMTDMLRSVVNSGTAANLEHIFKHYEQVPFAGKTGTTQNDADAWFIGYTPDLTLGVWSGYDQSRHSLTKSNCSQTAGCGTGRAKSIWAKVMDAVLENKPDLFEASQFNTPEGIVEITVSQYSGKLPTKELLDRNDVNTDLFNEKFLPTSTDDVAGMTRYIVLNGINYKAHPKTPNDMTYENFMVRREKSLSEIMKEIQAGLLQLPEQDRKPLSHYYPIDSELDGPVELDPRLDDGHIPSSTLGVNINNEDGLNLSFDMNKEKDVVGYRLYGSDNGRRFTYIDGKPVSSNSEAQFNVSDDQVNYYMYAITAVDVAGNESETSDIVFNRRKSIEDWFSEYYNEPEQDNKKKKNKRD
jgi:penicillin-binding protein